MKKHFPLFYTDTIADKNAAIKEGYIFLDTNVLLHFFRLGESFSKTFFQILDKVKERVFIPYQVAKEYHPKYLELCVSLRKTYLNAIDYLTQLQNPLDQLNSKKADYTRFFDKETRQECDELFSQQINTIKHKYEKEIEFLTKELENSALFNKIAGFFSDKVLEQLDPDFLEKTREQGKVRYDKKIPPGYKDSKKDENAFGDLIIWEEIINCVASKDDIRYAILVSDDIKEDWVLEIAGEKHGPRRELIEEFNQKAHARFICMSVATFIDAVQDFYNVVNKKDADDASDASSGFQETQRIIVGNIREKLSLKTISPKLSYTTSLENSVEDDNELYEDDSNLD